ncbi:Cytochrome p450 [Thalictrum thalictroides]|uniref:Cytochrome p450 n=1 Tax=Thalictrum thalictroides TaxID=46969 RepID=A0A7J6VB55_THATH|nr:Cytochrome p450 [Thalictrum thalictroides]
MITNLASKIMTVVSDGWLWWWDGSSIESKVVRLVFTLFIVVLVICWCKWVSNSSREWELPQPPGPRGLPLVGNLPFLEADLQRYFTKLAQVYGPILKIRMGKKICVVLSSPSLVKEVLRDHDAIFAYRDAPIAGLAVTYGGLDIAWSPHGPMWRMLRKVLVGEMLSNTSLEASYGLRQQEVQQKMKELYTKIGAPVNIGQEVFLMTSNVILSMLWGGTLHGKVRSSVGSEFQQVVGEIVQLLGKPNVSDIFPVLARFDLQGIEHRAKELLSWLDKIFNSVIEQKQKKDEAGTETTYEQNEKKDFLQFLLELKEQQDAKTPLTILQLKGLFMDIVVGGTDTTSATLEWAIAEMMQRPVLMKKAQAELEEVVGMNNMVEETHLSRLHYLDAVVKETLRLHPALPLLVPHCSSQSCTIGGYTVPKGASVFFNVWAMQRDPALWENPLAFHPERFLGDNIKCDYKGNDFHFLPFGSGRRICAGIPLAERMVKYVLASLLHSFEWRLPEGSKLDFAEKFGLVLKKATPVVAIPTPRLLNLDLYN